MSGGASLQRILLIVAGVSAAPSVAAARQIPETWAMTLGADSPAEIPEAMLHASNGHYLIGGGLDDIGVQDAWLVDMDATGKVFWQTRFSLGGGGQINAIAEKAGGGYLIAGTAGQSPNHLWVASVSADGALVWDHERRRLTAASPAFGVLERPNGRVWVLGHLSTGDFDGWIVELDANGSFLSERLYGGPEDDRFEDFVRSDDGGLLIVGDSRSPLGGDAIWLLKLDAAGNEAWQRTIGGGGTAVGANAVARSASGGYLVAGSDYVGGATDFLVLEIDAGGDVLWQRSLSGADADVPLSILATPDGGALVAGRTRSFGHGLWDAWVVRFAPGGAVVSQRAYGSHAADAFHAVELAPTGYLFAGYTYSYGGNAEFLIARTDENGWIGDCNFTLPTAASVVVTQHPTTLLPPSMLTGTSTEVVSSAVTTSTFVEPFALCTKGPGRPACFGDGSVNPCPCGNVGDLGAGCANSVGPGSRLYAHGSAGIGAGDLSLRAQGGAPGQPGLFFQGQALIQGGSGQPFGDGLRCVGNSVVRIQTVPADAAGASMTSVDVAATGGVAPGDLRFYQLWYRDPSGSPCGAQFNLGNALEILWAP